MIQSIGVLAPDAALPSLLKLMEDAQDPNVSRYAVQALGRYGGSTQQVKVLDERTGRKLADAQTWLERAQEHKRRLGGLFTFER